jgi:hypothetical protein
MLGNRWPHKPPLGYLLDKENPLAQGLIGFYAINENTGTTLNDACNQLNLTALGAGNLWGAGSLGPGLSLTTTGRGAQGVVPAALQSGWPMTLAIGFQVLGTPSNSAVIWEISYNSINLSPFIVANVQYEGTTGLQLQWNSAGTQQSLVYPTFTPVAGAIHVVLCEITPSSQSIWLDGQMVASASGSLSSPRWTSTSTLCIGSFSGYTQTTPNMVVYWSGWWNRVLQPSENQAVAHDPWQIFEPRRAQAYFGLLRAISSPARPRMIATEMPTPEVGSAISNHRSTPTPVVTEKIVVTASESPWPYTGSVLSTADRFLAGLPFSPKPSAIITANESQPSYPGSVLRVNTNILINNNGYHIYSNTGSDDLINYTTPLGTALISDTSWTSTALTAPGTWRFGVHAFNFDGEEQNLDCSVTIVLDAFGNDISNQPLSPMGIRSFATPNGSIRVEWYYPSTRGPTAPIGFNVYIGIGLTPNYSTPAKKVLYSAGLYNVFVANISGLIDETTYSVGVRAYNWSGEEQNTITVSVTADATGPAAVSFLLATTV